MKRTLRILCFILLLIINYKVGAVTTDKEGPILKSISFADSAEHKYTLMH